MASVGPGINEQTAALCSKPGSLKTGSNAAGIWVKPLRQNVKYNMDLKGVGGVVFFFSVPLSFKVTVKAPDYMSQYQCRKGDLNKALFTRTQTKRTGSTHGTLFKHQAICLKNPVLVMFQARADIETRSKNKKKSRNLKADSKQ